MPTRRTYTPSSAPRRRSAIPVAATALAFSLLASGCGGGGYGNSRDEYTPTDSIAEAAQARTDLSALLAGSDFDANGLSAIDSGKLTSIRDRFALAYAANNKNTEAAFGLAVTDLAVNAQALVTAAGGDAETRGAQARVAASRHRAAAVAKTTALNAIVRPLLLGGSRSLRSLTKNRAALSLVALPLLRTRQTTAVSTVTVGFQNLLAALNRDLPLLALGANDPQFSFPLSGVGGSGVTTTLDEADARGFEAGAFGARAGVQVALAYDLDTPSFDLSTPVANTISATGGGTITPSQYLPPAPFGQLQSNGKVLFASAKSDLAALLTTTQSDIPLFQARTGTATHLFPTSDLTAADYSSLQLGLSAAQYALDHAVTTGGVTYNLVAWFANPPASLTALEPTYHGVGGQYVASAADYPDKTFGGLVSGLPDSDYAVELDPDVTYGDLAGAGLFAPLYNLLPDDSSDD